MSQQASPPPYQQPYVQPKQPVEYLRPIASDFLLAIGVIVGLFLLMLGGIIIVADQYSGAVGAGLIVALLGTFIVSAALFLGAIVRMDMEKLVRFGFILAAAVLIVYTGSWVLG